MTRLDANTRRTISESVTKPVATGAADESALSSGELQENRIGWKRVIDDQLIEWGMDPDQLEDEGIEAPSRKIISRAWDLARRMRDGGAPPPLRVVPNGDGGITFEWKDGPVFETIELEDDGSIEIIKFVDSEVVSRHSILIS
ncbi:MAG: hypothetical protein HQ581_27915 [Planctomycetes bacterium]|nr:hypothetical protein [Planctomycetota bacterium]